MTKRLELGMRTIGQSSLLLMGLMIGAAAPAAAQAAAIETQQLVVEPAPAQRALADVKAPPSDLTVTAWVDQQDNTYTVGETLSLTVQANADAYVTVLNVGTNGQTTVLFPNRFQPDNRVTANRPFQVPSRESGSVLRVGGPGGTDVIKVIASNENVPVLGQIALQQAGAYSVAAQSADEIAGVVAMTIGVEGAPAQPGIKWADYTKVIQVTEAVAAAPRPVPAPSGFTLTVAPDRPLYRIGEPINLQVTASKDCHLTVLNVDASNQTRQLFPNQFQQSSKVTGGLTVLIPGNAQGVQYLAEGPIGQETVTAICTTAPTPVVSAASSEPFGVIGDASVVSQAIGVVRVQPSGETAMASTSFQVAPR